MNEPNAEWPVTWDAVKDEQLKIWLRATPAQRLAQMEEILELARLARQVRPSRSSCDSA
jgi:hypothetical protein